MGSANQDQLMTQYREEQLWQTCAQSGSAQSEGTTSALWGGREPGKASQSPKTQLSLPDGEWEEVHSKLLNQYVQRQSPENIRYVQKY